MANTILEKLQEKYYYAEGINDARNIAEAMACIGRTGGRGANAIADHIWKTHSVLYRPNGGTGDPFGEEYAEVSPVDLSLPASWTAPEGKEFAGFGETSYAANPVESPYYLTQNSILYAIWKDAE